MFPRVTKHFEIATYVYLSVELWYSMDKLLSNTQTEQNMHLNVIECHNIAVQMLSPPHQY